MREGKPMLNDDDIRELVEVEILHAHAVFANESAAPTVDPMGRFIPFIALAVGLFTVLVITAGLVATITY